MTKATGEKQRLIQRIALLEQRIDRLRRELDWREDLSERRSKQLRALAAELLHAEQDERKRLASCLHDDLQQMLVLVKFRLEALEEKIPEECRRELKHSCLELERAIQSSRDLSTRLRPPILDEAGLAPALKWLGDWYERQHDLHVEIDITDVVEPASQGTRAFLYRAVNELLFNVIKHAGVDRARLALRRSGSHTEICIEDEGCGMDYGAVLNRRTGSGGLGLRSIANRFEVLGGRMNIESEHGRGTRIRLLAPIDDPTSEVLDEPIALEDGSTLVVDIENRAATVYEPGESDQIRVLIADDHQMFREGLVGLLSEQPDINVVGQAANGRLAVSLAHSLRPDVIVMDLEMPHLSGIDATRAILAESPQARVFILSMHDASELQRAAEAAGAAAFLTKSAHAKELLQIIRDAVGTKPA